MMPVPILVSRPYMGAAMESCLTTVGATRVMLDSGAFSYHQRGEYPTVSDYAGWLDGLSFRPERYFVLDVIGDAEATRANYQEMKSAGYDPLPIWTTGAPAAHLREYARGGRVAIGGLIAGGAYGGITTAERNHHRITIARKLSGDLHLLGMSKPIDLERYRPSSVDNSVLSLGGAFHRYLLRTGKRRLVAKPIPTERDWRPLPRDHYLTIARMGVDPNRLLSSNYNQHGRTRQGHHSPGFINALTWCRYALDWLQVGTLIYAAIVHDSIAHAIHYAYQHGLQEGLWTADDWNLPAVPGAAPIQL